MKLKALFLTLLAVLFAPTLAFAAAEVHATGVGALDFRPLLQEILTTAFAVLSVIAIWVLRRIGEFVKTKTGVNVLAQEQLIRGYLDAAMLNALKFASTQVDKADWAQVETKNVMVGFAADYLMKSVPDAIKYFGLTRESIIEKLYARFPDLEVTLAASTATPAVVVNTAPMPATAAKPRSSVVK